MGLMLIHVDKRDPWKSPKIHPCSGITNRLKFNLPPNILFYPMIKYISCDIGIWMCTDGYRDKMMCGWTPAFIMVISYNWIEIIKSSK